MDMDIRGGGWCRSIGLFTAIVAAGLLVSGCVAMDGPPRPSLKAKGLVEVSTPVTATLDSGQTLFDYGVYYSTDQTAVVAVVGTAGSTSGQMSFVETLAVQKVTIAQSTGVAPSQPGTLAVTLSGLKPSTTYYYRFFTHGQVMVQSPVPPYIPMPQPVQSALQVSSFKTASAGVVGNPVAPTRMAPGAYSTVYGSLKPRHPAGSSPVRVYMWKRLADSTWEPRGFVYAKVKNYSSYSRYYKSMSFSKGTWRLRALHPASGNHASIWSPGFDYVSVR